MYTWGEETAFLFLTDSSLYPLPVYSAIIQVPERNSKKKIITAMNKVIIMFINTSKISLDQYSLIGAIQKKKGTRGKNV